MAPRAKVPPPPQPQETQATPCGSTEFSRFYSLEWTFIERLMLPSRNGSTFSERALDVYGSGPYLYWSKDEGQTFGPLINVFEATGTYVRGIVNFGCMAVVVWGDSYLAHIQFDQLMNGGTVCQHDIISTGRSIVSIQAHRSVFSPIEFDLYFADGTMQSVFYGLIIPRGLTLLTLSGTTFRLPLLTAETITSVNKTDRRAYFGTSKGRFIAVKDGSIVSITETKLNVPIIQIVPIPDADVVFLLSENGSIISWRNKNCIAELQGRYTCMYPWRVAITVIDRKEEKYAFAGDKDGTLTAFHMDKGKLKVFKSWRNMCINAITVIQLISGKKFVIGSSMGELQWFHLDQLVQYEVCDLPPPGVSNSDRHFKTACGWYFLKDNKLSRGFKRCKKHKMKKRKTELFCQKENLKIKYLACSGTPDREILFAHTVDEWSLAITDFSTLQAETVELFDIHDSATLTNKRTIIQQVILMQSYILIQLVSGDTKLCHMELEKGHFNNLYTFLIEDEIKAAACIETRDPETPAMEFLDLVIAQQDGQMQSVSMQWENGRSLKDTLIMYDFTIDPRGIYIVSMIASPQHIGSRQCIALSHSGTAYLLVSKYLYGQDADKYTTAMQQDLSGIIGRGHSLVETSLAILAAGFKQHTLHVCQLTLRVDKSPHYQHIFSVSTSSSRLPFTIIEEKVPIHDGSRVTDNQLIVSYCQDGMKEERFAFLEPTVVNNLRHSGIITRCFINKTMTPEGRRNTFYSGDSDGRFCIWYLNNDSDRGLVCISDFKLNGAVTYIHKYQDYMVAATSQGDLHLYKMVNNWRLQVLPLIPYNVGQKINCLMANWYRQDSLFYLFVFLQDGTVKMIRLKTDNEDNLNGNELIEQRNAAKFAVATKSAAHTMYGKDTFILALGVDNILRRARIDDSKVYRINWKISAMMQAFSKSEEVLLVADPQGWLYVMITPRQGDNKPYCYMDQYHRAEIIDIAFPHTRNKEVFIATLDVTGTVVVRKPYKPMETEEVIIWSCPVQSPRQVDITSHGQIIVFGKGIATRNL